jgi:hypothetical protein
MSSSRRSFMKWAASLSTLAVTHGTQASTVSLFCDERGFPAGPGQLPQFHPESMPTQTEVWNSLEWMAKLGPKYTGNPAHVKFVDWLATNLQSTGLQVERDRYSFPRWEATRWDISAAASGAVSKIPVTSYFPYSGRFESRFQTRGLAGQSGSDRFCDQSARLGHDVQALGRLSF